MPDFKRFGGDPDDLAMVVAFDPGGTTGYCVMGVVPEALSDPSASVLGSVHYIDYGQIDCGTRHGETGAGMERGHDGLNLAGEFLGQRRMFTMWDGLSQPPVVCEDFVLDMNKANMGRDLLTPVRIISGFAAIAQYCYGVDALQSIFIQNRSLAKTTCTDDRLKNWGLYDRNSGPHARDATRHAIYFLRSCSDADDRGAIRRHNAWPDLFSDPAINGKNSGTQSKKSPRQKSPRQKTVGERVTGLK